MPIIWRRIGPEPKPCSRWHEFPEQTMIKIVAANVLNDHEIKLRFSDDSSGIVDFTLSQITLRQAGLKG